MKNLQGFTTKTELEGKVNPLTLNTNGFWSKTGLAPSTTVNARDMSHELLKSVIYGQKAAQNETSMERIVNPDAIKGVKRPLLSDWWSTLEEECRAVR